MAMIDIDLLLPLCTTYHETDGNGGFGPEPGLQDENIPWDTLLRGSYDDT